MLMFAVAVAVDRCTRTLFILFYVLLDDMGIRCRWVIHLQAQLSTDIYICIYIYTHILHTLPLRCHSSISSPCCGVCPAPPIPLAREVRGRIRRHGNTATQRKLDEVIEALSPAAMPGLQCSSCSGVKLLSF